MRILHHRRTRDFLALLVRCKCGRKFLHRLDRPVVVCLCCGCIEPLGRLVDKVRAAENRAIGRAPKAARRSRALAS